MSPVTSLSRPRQAIALAALVLTLACGGDSGTDVSDITGVTVSPGTATLSSFGATQQMSATARTASGTATASFSWSSSNASVASVSATGLVTAVAEGTTTVTASVVGGSMSGSATITVSQEAASISVSLTADTLLTGETAQGSAEGEDAGGTPLASPNFSWSSSDETVATVDGNGLVSAVSDGEVTITATQDGATGNAALVVIRPVLNVTADTTLADNLTVDSLTVAAGTTITLSGDVEIDAKTSVSIAGTVTGDCTDVKIGGDGAVRISGTVNVACADPPTDTTEALPGVTIESPAGVDLTDATIVASGPVTISSEVSSAYLARAPSRRGGATASVTTGTVDLTGANIRAEPTEAKERNGSDIKFTGSTAVIVDGTTIRAQHGAPGTPANVSEASNVTARGTDGGSGGDIDFVGTSSANINFKATRGQTQLIAGDGGPGGPATATALENATGPAAPSATATGGLGGRGGHVSIFGDAFVAASDVGQILWQVGFGGRGGNATAVGANGVDADDTRDAQAGGEASAHAGSGGSAGATQGGFTGMTDPDPKQGGGGGTATATAGDGGDGIRSRPHGAVGGDAFSTGGNSGTSTLTSGRTGGEAIALGGNGGHGADVCSLFNATSLNGTISVNSDPASSDLYIFSAGAGIALSVTLRILDQLAGPGGNGGGGGLLGVVAGEGGMGRNVRAPNGATSLGSGGNGGNGGAGSPSGAAGSAGAEAPNSDTDWSPSAPLFAEGSAGGSCASLAPPVHTNVTALSSHTVEINGTGAWVNVTGSIADDGTVTATGRGTVAGVPNILAEFSGTWDEATQTLTGTYSLDSEKVIVSGHPVIYNITASGG